MTYGTVQRTSGELTVFGYDPKTHNREIKRRMGVVTQENALDESLTVFENMMIYSAFIGLVSSERKKRVEELLEYMNLMHKKDMPIAALSGGMKRRLVFVRANSLDELTTLHTKNNLTPLQIRPSNLEDVFLKLTGQDLSIDA